MDWLPLMDFHLVVSVAIGLIVVVLLLYLPLVAVLSRSFNDSSHSNRWTVRPTKFGYVLYLLMGYVILVGLVHETYVPNTWLGALVKSAGGVSGWTFVVSVAGYLVALGLHGLGVELHDIRGGWWEDPEPVPVWKPIKEDKELMSGTAFAIEFLNDEQTKMAFVISVFRNCFGMDLQTAYQGMAAIHQQGRRVIGSMSRTNAEALLLHIQTEVARRDFPFQCKVVPVPEMPIEPVLPLPQ